jgi:hypothetical protein
MRIEYWLNGNTATRNEFEEGRPVTGHSYLEQETPNIL